MSTESAETTVDPTDLSDEARRELAVSRVAEIVASKEPDDDAPEREEAEKKPEPVKEEGAKEELDELALRVKRREVLQAERAKAKEEHDFLTSSAQQELAKVRAAAAEVQQQKAWLESLRSDPIRAIRELGIDAEDFLMQLAGATSPEEKARQEKSKEESRIEKLERQLAERTRQEQEQAQAYERQQQAVARETAIQQFSAIAFAEEKHPHLVALYEDRPQELIKVADSIAFTYRQRTGLEATFEELAEYLESEAAKTVSKAQSRLQARSATQNSASQQAKPLSSKDAATRQAPDVPVDDDAARYEAAKRAVKQIARQAEANGKD
jgi:hypothetical protein